MDEMKLKVINLFNTQFEFTALHGAIHDFTNLEQEFEQIKIFKINNYIIKMAQFKKNKIKYTKSCT